MTRAEKESSHAAQASTHAAEVMGSGTQEKWTAASVSIYSSVGDDDEAGVRVNILHAARPIVRSLSLTHTLTHTHTHTHTLQSRCAALSSLRLALSVKSLMVRCHVSGDNHHVMMLGVC